MRMFATGDPEKLQLLRDLVPRIDRTPDAEGEQLEAPEELSLRTYLVEAADPSLVLRVVQTLLANLPGVRLDVDATSGKLVALARPSEHEVIEETLQQLAGQGKKFEVIPLKRVDPELAVMAINKFFRLTSEDEEAEPDLNAPIVDGDPISMQLWVRGTDQQIAQIKELVDKLESEDRGTGVTSNLRMIPLSGPAAQSALDTIQQFWTRKNKIRLLTPSDLQHANTRLRSVTPADSPQNADGG
jgi:hypothetical protein